ncbi:MAG: CPBP family intramembrane metalloprotease [Spirochaetes bacterium]|nr:CPBP family intramembrane metalloprotease [Spirochaetota bacterium]
MTNYKEFITPVSIVVATLALSLIHIFVCSARFFCTRIAPRLRLTDESVAQSLGVLYKRITSFLLFTVSVVIFIKVILGESLKRYGLSKGGGQVPTAVVLPLLVLSALTLLFYSKRERVYKNYPEVELARVSKGYFVVSTFTYVLYFFGYESLYRGFLLFGLRRYTGDWISIVVSMAFTAFTHLRAPKHLLLGTVVTGFTFPYVCLATESIRLIFMLHCLIGIGMDILCIRTRTRVEMETGPAMNQSASERR